MPSVPPLMRRQEPGFSRSAASSTGTPKQTSLSTTSLRISTRWRRGNASDCHLKGQRSISFLILHRWMSCGLRARLSRSRKRMRRKTKRKARQAVDGKLRRRRSGHRWSLPWRESKLSSWLVMPRRCSRRRSTKAIFTGPSSAQWESCHSLRSSTSVLAAREMHPSKKEKVPQRSRGRQTSRIQKSWDLEKTIQRWAAPWLPALR
mmetsp:Transcript_98443/g.175327  ORF Transcript_98443/g.175327 Transcript_98443/m.175327 type:complete len:205 (+) Transcript_98443:1045-1659(+)